MADEVLTARDGGVLTITLNRPEVYNALNRELHGALHAALTEAAAPDVRAVLLTGAGKAFCSGQDLTEFQELPGSIGEALEATYHPNIRLLRGLEKPVIAAVNGVSAGAGLSLALACDVRIASVDASFVPGFAGIGLVPDAGCTFFLHRLLGQARAFAWMTSNRRLDAREADAWGLVSEVLVADEFLRLAAEVAARYAALPTRAVAGTKRLFEQAGWNDLERQLAAEAAEQDAAARTADFAEGVSAFLEKRPARFTGA